MHQSLFRKAMRPMLTDDEQFCRSILAVALTRRVSIIASVLILLWLAILWAEVLP